MKQLYSLDRERLTKKEMLIEIGYSNSDAEYIAKKLKKDVIHTAWLKAYHSSSSYEAKKYIRKNLM